MSYRYLELTKALVPQRQILLDLLPGWDVSRLESALQTLNEDDLVDVQATGAMERIISLRLLTRTEKESVLGKMNLEVATLYRVLDGFIGK